MKNLKKLKKAELIALIGMMEVDKQKMQEEWDKEKLKLEDQLQDLNVKCKYHLFDAEASQREIKYFKKLLRDKEK